MTLSFAPFTGGVHGCDIALCAGFVSYLSEFTGTHLEFSKQCLLHWKASAKESVGAALEEPHMNQAD